MPAGKAAGLGRTLLVIAAGAVVVAASAGGAWLLRERLDRAAPAGPRAQAPRPADPLKRGRLLYEVNCETCHGPEGHGDGPPAAQLKPPPRDFAGPWRFGATPAVARKVVREGVRGTAMPGSP